MTSEQKLAIWKAANDARRENGQCELLWADFVAFLRDFNDAAIGFDAYFSEAMAETNVEARIHDANVSLSLLGK